MARLRAGTTRVVSNVELFGEGIDVPLVEAIILLRPTQSLGLYLQQVGRGLRAAEGKQDCIILDHAGCCLRHGLPDDDRDWSLEGARRRSKAGEGEESAPVRQCSVCYAINRATATVCKECGTPFEVVAREVEEVAGELAEVDPEQLRKAARIEQGRATTYEALVALGKARGYKPNWAKYVWATRQGRRAG